MGDIETYDTGAGVSCELEAAGAANRATGTSYEGDAGRDMLVGKAFESEQPTREDLVPCWRVVA